MIWNSIVWSDSLDNNYGCGPLQPTVYSFDFDNTITRDPVGMLAMMEFLEKRGHTVYVVTARHADVAPEDLDFLRDKGYKVFTTGLRAKRKYMLEQGIEIDVWVDDSPGAVYQDYKGAGKGYTFRDVGGWVR